MKLFVNTMVGVCIGFALCMVVQNFVYPKADSSGCKVPEAKQFVMPGIMPGMPGGMGMMPPGMMLPRMHQPSVMPVDAPPPVVPSQQDQLVVPAVEGF